MWRLRKNKMTQFQKQENSKYFVAMIKLTKDGGFMPVPSMGQMFQIINGKMHGTYKGITQLRKMTDKTFHSRTVIFA